MDEKPKSIKQCMQDICRVINEYMDGECKGKKYSKQMPGKLFKYLFTDKPLSIEDDKYTGYSERDEYNSYKLFENKRNYFDQAAITALCRWQNPKEYYKSEADKYLPEDIVGLLDLDNGEDVDEFFLSQQVVDDENHEYSLGDIKKIRTELRKEITGMITPKCMASELKGESLVRLIIYYVIHKAMRYIKRNEFIEYTLSTKILVRIDKLKEFHTLIKEKRLVILSAPSGMGKTFFLRSFINNIKWNYKIYNNASFGEFCEGILFEEESVWIPAVKKKNSMRYRCEQIRCFSDPVFIVVENFNQTQDEIEKFKILVDKTPNLYVVFVTTNGYDHYENCTFHLERFSNNEMEKLFYKVMDMKKTDPFFDDDMKQDIKEMCNKLNGVPVLAYLIAEYCGKQKKKGLNTKQIRGIIQCFLNYESNYSRSNFAYKKIVKDKTALQNKQLDLYGHIVQLCGLDTEKVAKEKLLMLASLSGVEITPEWLGLHFGITEQEISYLLESGWIESEDSLVVSRIPDVLVRILTMKGDLKLDNLRKYFGYLEIFTSDLCGETDQDILPQRFETIIMGINTTLIGVMLQIGFKSKKVVTGKNSIWNFHILSIQYFLNHGRVVSARHLLGLWYGDRVDSEVQEFFKEENNRTDLMRIFHIQANWMEGIALNGFEEVGICVALCKARKDDWGEEENFIGFNILKNLLDYELVQYEAACIYNNEEMAKYSMHNFKTLLKGIMTYVQDNDWTFSKKYIEFYMAVFAFFDGKVNDAKRHLAKLYETIEIGSTYDAKQLVAQILAFEMWCEEISTRAYIFNHSEGDIGWVEQINELRSISKAVTGLGNVSFWNQMVQLQILYAEFKYGQFEKWISEMKKDMKNAALWEQQIEKIRGYLHRISNK